MAAAPPTGTVALVFTDVQGSTSLWERAPDAMRAALAVHDATMRASIERANGYEVKTEGDAFMVAFGSSRDAVRFCLLAQEALLDADWPPEILVLDAAAVSDARRGLRVRMGVHVGEPDVKADPVTGRMDYFGPVVNRAARVSSAAHGGQVIVSGRVFKEIQPALAELGGPAVADLGEHRLKDLESAERLVQLLPSRLAARTFPPLRTLDARKTNLQSHPTRFVGRDEDLAALHALFQKGERLVTLMGPGGTGKTRLSMRYAAVHLDEFTREGGGGTWFCDLTEARTIDGICASVGAALNVPLTTGKTSADVVAQLGHAIAGRGRVLLVLDNFEQVIGLAPETVGAWSSLAPKACFLVSSQERLRLPGEVPYELKPLSLPEGADALASEAVQLFVERARAVRPGWTPAGPDVEAVAGIVRELDGIPLAIELAAARIGVLPAAKILERLPRRFDLLGGARRDATARQATLRGAIDWSWNLLKPHEQDALAQCSVFHGGFDVEAAEAVLDLSAHDGAPWPLDVVESLRDKSLLRAWEPPDFPGELRFGMYSNIRQYAQEKLDSVKEKADAAKARHAEYYLRAGEDLAAGVDVQGGIEKLRRLALETDNLAAVLHRATAVKPPTVESASNAARAMLALDPVLSTRGPFGVHLAWLDECVEVCGTEGVDPILRARVLEARGRARRIRGRMAEAKSDLESAVSLSERSAPPVAARGYWQIGMSELAQGRNETALENLQKGLSIARATGDHGAAGQILGFLGRLHADRGEMQEATAAFEQSLEISRRLGATRSEAQVLWYRGYFLQREGRLGEARESLESALAFAREAADLRLEGNVLGSLAGVLTEEGRIAEARRAYASALGIHRDVGNRTSWAAFRGNLGILEQLEGDLKSANESFAAAVAMLQETGERRAEGLYVAYLAASEATLGRVEESEALFARAESRLMEVHDPSMLAALAVLRGILDLALAQRASDPEIRASHRRAARGRIQAVEGGSDALSASPISEDVRLAVRLVEQGLAEAANAQGSGRS